MKGLLICGGLGSRLYPLTKNSNKHLLPIYNKPMFWYPLNTLIQNGIKDITIVTSPVDQEKFQDYLQYLDISNDITFNFAIQEYGDRGIADAIMAARRFVEGENVAIILGDNIFSKIPSFEFKGGAHVFLYNVGKKKATDFGCPIFNKSKIVNLIEKPENPESGLIVTGLYLLDSRAFEYIETLKPSSRGQLEITDLLKCYLPNITYSKLGKNSFWLDAGTFENLHKANCYWYNKNNG